MNIKQPDVSANTRTLMIIMLALAGGVIMIVGFFAATQPMGPTDNYSPMVVMGFVGAVLAAVMRAILPPLMVGPAIKRIAHQDADEEKRNDVKELSGVFMTRGIIAGSILEGAAMLNAIVFMMEHNPLNLGVAVGLALGIVANIPSQNSMVTWIEDHLRTVNELRATNW